MKNLITYILQNTKMTQKDLAAAIGVSGAQISKWKSGESIPQEREFELMEVAQIPPNFQLLELAGTQENIDQWFYHLRNIVIPCFEHGLDDDYEYRDLSQANLQMLLETFRSFGLAQPFPAPTMIEDKEGNISFEQEMLAELSYEILENLSDIRHWLDTYINFRHYIQDSSAADELADLEAQIYYESFHVAATCIDKGKFTKINADAFDSLREKAENEMAALIQSYLLKLKLGFDRTPLVDLYDLINETPNQLAIDAEQVHKASYLTLGDRFTDLTYKNTMLMLNTLCEKLEKLEAKVDDLSQRLSEPEDTGLFGPPRFGKNLKALRTLAQMSESRLVTELSGLGLSTTEAEIKKWELESIVPEMEVVTALSKLFKVQPADLILGKP